MFGNTLIIPHADGNVTCVKINQDGYSSEYLYRSATKTVSAKIRHTTTKAALERHNVEFTETIFATDVAVEIVRKVYIVLEIAKSDTDVKLTDALADWLIATANANVTSLLGWES